MQRSRRVMDTLPTCRTFLRIIHDPEVKTNEPGDASLTLMLIWTAFVQSAHRIKNQHQLGCWCLRFQNAFSVLPG